MDILSILFDLFLFVAVIHTILVIVGLWLRKNKSEEIYHNNEVANNKNADDQTVFHLNLFGNAETRFPVEYSIQKVEDKGFTVYLLYSESKFLGQVSALEQVEDLLITQYPETVFVLKT